jgi:hypothetical protein
MITTGKAKALAKFIHIYDLIWDNENQVYIEKEISDKDLQKILKIK